MLAFFVYNSKTNAGNITINFLGEVQMPEIRAFYGWQVAKENIHSEV
jgi:ribonucleoside-diphosphate reductase beta chain